MTRKAHEIIPSGRTAPLQAFLVLILLSVPFVFVLSASAALDAASAGCVGCHETTVDPDTPGVVCHAEGCNHAVGVDYAAAAGAMRSLTPPDELPAGVRLVGGVMGCTTCHVPYSEADHQALADKRALGDGPDPMLSIDNAGSALCLACHRK